MNVNLVSARMRRDLTQEQAATRAGVSPADMVRLERHEWIPSKTVRKRLAKVLRCSEEALFGEIIGALVKGR